MGSNAVAASRRAFARVDHRPWPLPDRHWVMEQVWHDLLFAHWPVPPETLRSRLPAGINLETHEGSAWLGVVPFRMSGVRLRGVPTLPWISKFPELNVRTYVTAAAEQGRPGVYFFSLDAARTLAVWAARRWFHLPYFRARMRCEELSGEIHYRSRRIHAGAAPAELSVRYAAAGEVFQAHPGSLEHWLVERYRLYTADRAGRVWFSDIQHPPWQLQAACASVETNTMAGALGLELGLRPPLLHFSRRQDVVVWSPEPLVARLPGRSSSARA